VALGNSELARLASSSPASVAPLIPSRLPSNPTADVKWTAHICWPTPQVCATATSVNPCHARRHLTPCRIRILLYIGEIDLFSYALLLLFRPSFVVCSMFVYNHPRWPWPGGTLSSNRRLLVPPPFIVRVPIA
jgi:hypothetical protein